MKTMTINLKSNPGVTLAAYLLDYYEEMPNTIVRPAVLICPGGGYKFCSDREAEPVAMAFLAEGYQAFILRYSLNENASFPKPLNDAEEALKLIRKNAEEWRVDPEKIVACGFSAGGHLSAALGTMGKVRPNALILGYPVTLDTLSDILPVSIPSLVNYVDQNTPPTFIFSTANDELVPVNHSIRFAAALDSAKIPFELHIFQKGSHGLSLSKPLTSIGFRNLANTDVAKWMELCIAWLKNVFGDFKADAEIFNSISREKATEYSVNLVLEACLENPNCKKIILEYIPDWDSTPIFRVFMDTSLLQINEYYKLLDAATLDEMDQKLKAIPFP